MYLKPLRRYFHINQTMTHDIWPLDVTHPTSRYPPNENTAGKNEPKRTKNDYVVIIISYWGKEIIPYNRIRSW